ncbi:hypothetical protein ACJIZ3_022155 [Penstemon smallii]|uniref:Uncharacterized protein n=1 Tax=Penstemon smallii TaxID=265156 RepID=A0ABD3SP37_9LAMI
MEGRCEVKYEISVRQYLIPLRGIQCLGLSPCICR